MDFTLVHARSPSRPVALFLSLSDFSVNVIALWQSVLMQQLMRFFYNSLSLLKQSSFHDLWSDLIEFEPCRLETGLCLSTENTSYLCSLRRSEKSSVQGTSTKCCSNTWCSLEWMTGNIIVELWFWNHHELEALWLWQHGRCKEASGACAGNPMQD